MVSHTRRSLLQTSAIGLSILAAGCSSERQTGKDDPAAPDEKDEDEEENKELRPPGSPPLNPSGEWPLYRFDAGNTGANLDGTGLRNGTEYWRLNVNAGGPATLADGTLYNNTRSELTFRDSATAAIKTSIPVNHSGTLPIVANSRVLVTRGNVLSCFNIDTGKKQWKRFANREIVSSPIVHDGKVIINSGGRGDSRLHAYGIASGEELWEYNAAADSQATPAVGESRVFLSSEKGLHAIELSSGDDVYTVTGEMDSGGTPVIHGQTVYVTNSDDELVAADDGDGTIRWRVPVWRGADPPVVTDDTVYTCTKDQVIALDSTTGDLVSSRSSAMRRPMGIVGDVLYGIGGEQGQDGLGTVFAFDVANEFKPLWSLTTAGIDNEDYSPPHVNHITPVNGAVYVSARSGFYGVGPAE